MGTLRANHETRGNNPGKGEDKTLCTVVFNTREMVDLLAAKERVQVAKL